MLRGVLISGAVLALVCTFSMGQITVVGENSGTNLANAILGSGITISNVTYTGANNQAGTFTGGLSAGIGIDTGIVLTSGDATIIDNLNNADGAGAGLGTAGDADLNGLLPSGSTNDANILEFDITSAGGDLFFNYVFGSEEYNEFTNSQFNDVFGFFLDGVNIALLPDGVTEVSINTVNGGNPFGTGASNPGLFNNNDLSDGGPFFAFEYDGFTDVLTASILGLSAGTHHLKLAIADTGDTVLDSGVFIQGGSLSDTPTTPEPGTLALLGLGLLGCGSLARRFSRR